MSNNESPLENIKFKLRIEKKGEKIYEVFLDDKSVCIINTTDILTDEATFFEVQGEKIA